jgi:hypothetical protein
MGSRIGLTTTALTALLGVAGAIATGVISYQAGLRTVEKDYVAISANILSNPNSDKALKRWAVEVIDELSPVKVTREAREAFINLSAINIPSPPSRALEPCEIPALTIDPKSPSLKAGQVEQALVDRTFAIANCESKRKALADAWPRNADAGSQLPLRPRTP